MASLADRLKAIREGQEVDDATDPASPAIDSSVSLIGTRDTEAIRKARLRAKRLPAPKPKSSIEDVSSELTGETDYEEEKNRLLREYELNPEDLPFDMKVAHVAASIGPKLKGIAKGTKMAYDVADLGMEKGKIGHRIKTGEASAEDHKRLKEINQKIAGMSKELEEVPFVAKSFGTLAPFLVESAEKGGKGALIGGMAGGTMAAIATLVEPTPIGEIASPLTVPAATALGAKIGSSFASVSNIAEIEGGSAYLEMVDMGMDNKKAAIASDIIGTGSGLLELAQFKMLKRLLPGSDKIASSALAKGIQKVIGSSGPGRAVAKLGSAAVPEAGVETVQELWNNIITTAATDVRKDLDNTDLSPQSIDEYVDRYKEGLWETFATTVTGFGVAALPGVSIDVAMGGKPSNTQQVDAGQTLIVNDEKTDPTISDVAEAEEVAGGRESVKDLLGVNAKEEAGEEISEPGTTISADMTTTPQLTKESVQTGNDLSQILDAMRLKKSMAGNRVAVLSNKDKLSSLNEAYESAVFDEDPQAALAIAKDYEATVADTTQRMGQMVQEENQLSAKNREALDPRTLIPVQRYLEEQAQIAQHMVNGQQNAVAIKEAEEASIYKQKLHEEPEVLNEALIKKERAEETKPEHGKIYRQISDDIELKKYMKPESFFKKHGQVDKLIKMRGDLTRKIQDEQISQDVTEADRAVDQATLNWVNNTIEEAVQLEEAQAQADLNKQRETLETKRYNQEVQAAKERTVAEGKESQVQTRVKAIREQEAARKQKVQATEREATAQKASELDKRRQAISAQAKKTRKQPATPVSADRKFEIEASKKRKAEIKKQQKMAEQLGDKPMNVEKMNVTPVQKTKAQKMFRSAGISVGNKVYEGNTHGDAVFRNPELQKKLNDPKFDLSSLTEGFVTKGGKFVNRKKASELIDAPNLQSEQFIETLKTTRKIGHNVQVDDVALENIEDLNEVYDMVNKDPKYGWFHTMAKAMGVKTNVIFGGERGLNNNVDYQKQDQRTKQQIVEAWDGVTGVASKSTFTNFLNAENLIGSAKAKTQETIAHETLHGVVRKKLSKLGEKDTQLLESDLKQLWDSIPAKAKLQAEKYTTKDGRQPIKAGIKQIGENIQELITYGLTSPDFASWLNSIPSLSKQGVQKKQSVWESLVNLIAKLVKPSKLTDLVNIMNSNLDLADPRAPKGPSGPKGGKPTLTKGRTPGEKMIEKMVDDSRESLDTIDRASQKDMYEAEQAFLESGNDGMSPTMKIHEWRDGAANNIDRMAHRMEQEYLEQFGGRETLRGPLRKSS
jgi:hypothetical protein